MTDGTGLATALLTEHMDGDFLVAAGMSVGNTGDDVAINDARPKEVAHWAEDAALAWVDARLADPATVEAVARAVHLSTHMDPDECECRPDPEDEAAATAALAVVRGLLGGTGGEG